MPRPGSRRRDAEQRRDILFRQRNPAFGSLAPIFTEIDRIIQNCVHLRAMDARYHLRPLYTKWHASLTRKVRDHHMTQANAVLLAERIRDFLRDISQMHPHHLSREENIAKLTIAKQKHRVWIHSGEFSASQNRAYRFLLRNEFGRFLAGYFIGLAIAGFVLFVVSVGAAVVATVATAPSALCLVLGAASEIIANAIMTVLALLPLLVWGLAIRNGTINQVKRASDRILNDVEQEAFLNGRAHGYEQDEGGYVLGHV